LPLSVYFSPALFPFTVPCRVDLWAEEAQNNSWRRWDLEGCYLTIADPRVALSAFAKSSGPRPTTWIRGPSRSSAGSTKRRRKNHASKISLLFVIGTVMGAIHFVGVNDADTEFVGIRDDEVDSPLAVRMIVFSEDSRQIICSL
jgi:hypothetical protein